MITGPESIVRIEKIFPQLSAELHSDITEGLLHLQIAEFARLTQAFIDQLQTESFDRASELFLELYEQGIPELVNALNVSYLENITFEDDETIRQWAYDRLPSKMRAAYEKMEEHNRRIHGS